MDKPNISVYPSQALHDRIMNALRTRYPGFVSLGIIFRSSPGMGKSTVLCSFPIPDDKERLIYDFEDSSAFLDATPQGKDVYSPQHMAFRMYRTRYPKTDDIVRLLQRLENPEALAKIGMVGIDNIAVFQDELRKWLHQAAANPTALRQAYEKMGLRTALPVDAKIAKWVGGEPNEFWVALKAIASSIVLRCSRHGVHFIGTTEESNVYSKYGTTEQKLEGKKAKIWDVWYRYCQMVVVLNRDPNPGSDGRPKPPTASISIFEPKVRMQGLMPSWTMTWEIFADEMEKAAARYNEAIPQERVSLETLASEAPETPLTTTQPEAKNETE